MANPNLLFSSQWPTEVRKVLPGGRLVGRDGSMWVLRAVGLSPVVDARSPGKIVDAAVPLLSFFSKLSLLASTVGGRRTLVKNTYRQYQLLLVNIPDLYQPGDNQLHDFLIDSYGERAVQRRLLVAAVRLVPKLRRKGENPVVSAVNSVAYSLISAGVPLEDYESDYETIDKAMKDCGFRELGTDTFGRSELNLVRFWINFGISNDIPMLVHSEHLHFFSNTKAAQTAQLLQQRSENEGKTPECEDWEIPDSHALTFATISNLELEWLSHENSLALWIVALMDCGARAISIRGIVEPPKVTKGELKRKRDQYLRDVQERQSGTGKSDGGQVGKLELLSEITNTYEREGGPPTSVDTSIVIAFDGIIPNISRHLGDRADNIELSSLLDRQQAALFEMELCSPIRAVPHLHDLPAPSVALSGIVNLSTVGDQTGALLGFTEYDRQPAYINPMAASDEDSSPIFMVAGGTGTGKTMTLLSLAKQWSQWRTRRGTLTPVILVDPKTGQDFSDPILKMGGQVFSLDDLSKADGALDPIRVIRDREEAHSVAVAALSSIDPWSEGGRKRFEIPLGTALRYGIKHGATCIVDALTIANKHSTLPEGLLGPVIELAESSPMARAIIGISPGGSPLREVEGLTLIRAGNMAIPLPDDDIPWDQQSIYNRVGSWVLRMMVYGAASAVSYRDGVVEVDEAWQFARGQAGRAELDRIGRLARSMQFLPVFASQYISDFTKAGLTGSISRGLVLPLPGGDGSVDANGRVDNGEAGRALDLFRISKENTPYLSRLTAKATKEGTTTPNTNSMRALFAPGRRDPVTGQRKLLRGTVALYMDLTERAVPTEIVIPPDFLAEISTNAQDVINREKAQKGA